MMSVCSLTRVAGAINNVFTTFTRAAMLQNLQFHSVRCRSFSKASTKEENTLPNKNKVIENSSVISKSFINRNPRNLEMMGIAWKTKGWRYQYPSREYYHRLTFERTNRHTSAYIEHCSGARVLSVSTMELAIARHLYSTIDVSAAHNIGRVLAQRCRESGLVSMVVQATDLSEKSEKFQAFRTAMLDGGIELTEPEEKTPDYTPGIDYDDKEAVEDLTRRQWLAYNLGEHAKAEWHLKDQQRHRGRRRPKRRPFKLEAPSVL